MNIERETNVWALKRERGHIEAMIEGWEETIARREREIERLRALVAEHWDDRARINARIVELADD